MPLSGRGLYRFFGHGRRIKPVFRAYLALMRASEHEFVRAAKICDVRSDFPPRRPLPYRAAEPALRDIFLDDYHAFELSRDGFKRARIEGFNRMELIRRWEYVPRVKRLYCRYRFRGYIARSDDGDVFAVAQFAASSEHSRLFGNVNRLSAAADSHVRRSVEFEKLREKVFHL